MSSTRIPQRLRDVLSFCDVVTTCPQRMNAMSSTIILQTLRYLLSFCEDMSSKGQFHNLNQKFFRGYVMSSPFVKTVFKG